MQLPNPQVMTIKIGDEERTEAAFALSPEWALIRTAQDPALFSLLFLPTGERGAAHSSAAWKLAFDSCQIPHPPDTTADQGGASRAPEAAVAWCRDVSAIVTRVATEKARAENLRIFRVRVTRLAEREAWVLARDYDDAASIAETRFGLDEFMDEDFATHTSTLRERPADAPLGKHEDEDFVVVPDYLGFMRLGEAVVIASKK